MIYEISLGDRVAQVSVRAADAGAWWVAIDGAPERLVHGTQLGTAEWLLRRGAEARRYALGLAGETAHVQVAGHGLRGAVIDPRKKALSATSGAAEGEVRTPMPGAVVRILVSEGDPVSVGQVLLVVEAMKMENEYKSAIDGTVGTVHVEEGQALEADAVLITVLP